MGYRIVVCKIINVKKIMEFRIKCVAENKNADISAESAAAASVDRQMSMRAICHIDLIGIVEVTIRREW